MTSIDTPASSGIPELDDIIGGGITRDRMYLVEGVPGSGKTTLALQFLLEGVKRGESVLYVTLSESEVELQAVARSHGWTLDGCHIRELATLDGKAPPAEQYTMFHPSEVELTDTITALLHEVERLKPSRVVIDSLSELRLLAGTPLRNRRQIMALKQFFQGRNCTVLLLDDLTSPDRDLQIQSVVHGVLLLEQMIQQFGADRRRLRVVKYRGRSFRGGFHDYAIVRGGLRVFPRLVAAEHRQEPLRHRFSSGLPKLDALLGGGLESGTSTLIVGPPGSGKSSIACQFVHAATQRKTRCTIFSFDEHSSTLLSRAASLGCPLEGALAAGLLDLEPVDPAELSPGEFASRIRAAVEAGVQLIVIDSLNGYLNAMPEERFLTIQLHELLMYLAHKGVATLLISAQQGLLGPAMTSKIDASYLADAVLLLRYFEEAGAIRQAISVMKKRGGAHERTIREFLMSGGRLELGEPLHELRGVLTGVPVKDEVAGKRRASA